MGEGEPCQVGQAAGCWDQEGEGHREGKRHVWSSRRKCIGCLGTGRAAQDGVEEGDLDIPDVRARLFAVAHRWGTHMNTHRPMTWWYTAALIDPDRGSKRRSSSCCLISSPLPKRPEFWVVPWGT